MQARDNMDSNMDSLHEDKAVLIRKLNDALLQLDRIN